MSMHEMYEKYKDKRLPDGSKNLHPIGKRPIEPCALIVGPGKPLSEAEVRSALEAIRDFPEATIKLDKASSLLEGLKLLSEIAEKKRIPLRNLIKARGCFQLSEDNTTVLPKKPKEANRWSRPSDSAPKRKH